MVKKIAKRLLRGSGYSLVRNMQAYESSEIKKHIFGDVVRLNTLILMADEIRQKGTEGSIAEVGVYKGDFAVWLNQLFPERTLYLFDTFEGFDNRDIEVERKRGYSQGNQDFTDTSIAAVERKLMFPKKAVFKQGFFPESARGG